MIMDGNGRWAKRRGMPRRAGHGAGSETFRTIATFCKDIGLDHLTVYALSTENRANRPVDELEGIFNLLRKYLKESLASMEKDRVKMKFIGDISPMPEDIQDLIAKTEEVSAGYEGCQVNICLNYGGRDELVRAARKLSGTPSEEITQESFANALDTAKIPDPDICIRTGGESRTSNFLPWQLAYAELYFTKTLWPDFSPKELTAILTDFSKRNRRYGGL